MRPVAKGLAKEAKAKASNPHLCRATAKEVESPISSACEIKTARSGVGAMGGAKSAVCCKRANPLRAVCVSGPFAGASWPSSSWRLFVLERQGCSDFVRTVPFWHKCYKCLTIALHAARREQRLRLLQHLRKEFQLLPQVFLAAADSTALSELMPPLAWSPIPIASFNSAREASVKGVEDAQSSGLRISSSLRALLAMWAGAAPNRLEERQSECSFP